jgi:hypothetical protein
VIPRCSTLLKVLAVGGALSLGLRPEFTQADGIANYTLTSTTGLSAPTGPPPGTPSVTLNSTVTTGSPTVSVPSVSALAIGYQVTGTGIPSGTTVSLIGSGGSQVTLSQNATASGSESLTFTPSISPQVVALIEPAGGVVTPASSSTIGPLTILSGSQGFNSSGVYDFLANTKDQNGNPLQALGLSFYGQGLASLAKGGILNFSLDVTNPSSPPQLISQTAGVTIALQSNDQSTGTNGGTTPIGTNTGGGQEREIPEPISILLWSALAGAWLLRTRGARRPRRT